MPYMKSIAIVFGIGIGSRCEEKKYQGISHLIEHMLFKGTKNRKSTLEISKDIESIGGSINASTSEENTLLYAKVPQKGFAIVFDVLSDIILNSLMRDDDLQREKSVVIEEIRKCQDVPEELVELLLDKLIWKNQPLGRGILGDEKSVNNIQRENVVSYINEFYRPNNIVISVAGNIKKEEVMLKVKEYFEEMKRKQFKKYLPASTKQENFQIGIKYKKTNQTHLCFGFPAISRMHPDRYSTDLMNIILGSGLSSRLFQEIRVKRSLAYDIHSYLQYFNDTGSFNIYAGADSKRLKETIKVILEELKKIRENDLSEEELTKAKEMYRGALSLSLESTSNQAFWLGTKLLLYGKPFTEDEVRKKIEEVRVEDVINSARNIFMKNKINLSVVGPFKEKNKEEFSSLFQGL